VPETRKAAVFEILNGCPAPAASVAANGKLTIKRQNNDFEGDIPLT